MELVTTVNEGEGQKKIVEAETGVQEGRQMKIEEEEDKEQSSVEEIEDFLSDKGCEIMEKKILKKEFISPFKEIIKKRGWKIIGKHMPPERAALVREFYANMVDRKET